MSVEKIVKYRIKVEIDEGDWNRLMYLVKDGSYNGPEEAAQVMLSRGLDWEEEHGRMILEAEQEK
jgi:hypothetical protein